MAGAITRLSFGPVLPREPKLKPSSLSSRIVACSTTGAKRPKSSVGTDELRTQLLQLQAEADKTRAKANDARLRLMRLSEAAENFRRRAAADVQSGKEDEARELLLQKRKVVQALEKSKSRIQVLDELAEKLNEAISMKETLLIGTVASDLEVSTDIDPCLVRIISPKNDKAEERNQPTRTELFDPAEMDDEEPDYQIDVQTKNVSVDGWDKNVDTPITSACNEETIIRSLKGISSYADFLDHLDVQLLHIEEELVTVLRLSSLVLGSDQGSAKAQQTLALLENVRGVRERHQAQARAQLLGSETTALANNIMSGSLLILQGLKKSRKSTGTNQTEILETCFAGEFILQRKPFKPKKKLLGIRAFQSSIGLKKVRHVS